MIYKLEIKLINEENRDRDIYYETHIISSDNLSNDKEKLVNLLYHEYGFRISTYKVNLLISDSIIEKDTYTLKLYQTKIIDLKSY